MEKEILIDLIRKKPYLFWYVRNIGILSEVSIVEAILNRGDFDDFLRLREILGMEKVAGNFYRQVSMKRKNYSKKTENYFRLFFEKHMRHV